jgi:hypothetical protein
LRFGARLLEGDGDPDALKELLAQVQIVLELTEHLGTH